MKYHVVISIDLEYTFDVSSKGEALVKAENLNQVQVLILMRLMTTKKKNRN